MTGLTLVPVGAVPAGLARRIGGFLAETLNRPCTVADRSIDPAAAYDSQRGQYDCRRLFPHLEKHAHQTGTIVLGMADVDLYSAIFTFVFGEAKLGGNAGIFSVHRLRPTLYGLPHDPELFESRARREALHETGHLLGLVHCRRPDCVMRFSAAAEEVDLKPDRFCDACRTRLSETSVTPGP